MVKFLESLYWIKLDYGDEFTIDPDIREKLISNLNYIHSYQLDFNDLKIVY